MQQPSSNSNQIIIKNTLDLGQFNLLRCDLAPWLSLIKPENQNLHQTPQQILTLLAQIPEIRIINNLILPNWIICSNHDIDFGLYGLLGNQVLLDLPANHKYKWIDARGITVYHPKVKAKLQEILAVLCSKCQYLIYQPHSFMTITEFWEWLMSCQGLTDANRTQIIFMKPNEAKTYRTAAAGIIPLEIARAQNEFYKNNLEVALGSPTLRNNLSSSKSITNTQQNLVEFETNIQQPILIQELNKLRIQLMAYHLTSPDELAIETGTIIQKINEIREYLGIQNNQ